MTSEFKSGNSFLCPIPIEQYPNVLMAHGGGGTLTHQLIEKMFLPAFGNSLLGARHDGAIFDIPSGKLAFTTDSYVVRPLFFPGGDIGTLAVNGTVNDLAMCGAHPLYLSAGFILEEGLPMDTLWRVVQSMKLAAEQAGVQIVTGDTKVVDRGKGDGIYINTAGVGAIDSSCAISPANVKPGDTILLSGDIGRHGIAIMAVREGLEFESAIESDCAPLSGIVLALLAEGIKVHCLRDLTRGGLASALIEIAETASLQFQIEETAIPMLEDVKGACEILGFDPLYVANEGRFIALVPAQEAERALQKMRAHPLGEKACIIGTAAEGNSGLVTMRSRIGATRVVDMLSGEQLPRIC
ncbi:MAG: hydrogenase expression/formation protein HypE [Acidobacteria bacterium]|nr:hydrogenase expression/formation protein HypE [Acidobacteriota bacterium]